jgi:ElaB/YqjD/DUF883 family membrane-anchored ribosome-binding protein
MQEQNSESRRSTEPAAGNPYKAGTAVEDEAPSTDAAASTKDKAMDTADQALDKAAGGMESAADTLREKVGDSGVTGAAGTRLADGMEKTAGYLRDHNTQEILEDLDRYVKEHPTQALIGAVAVGFVIGRMFR